MGEVTRTYIARKLTRGGKRFGFVSFGEDSDAARAIERLNGFNVYGYRLKVKVANQKNGFIGNKTNDGIGNKSNKVGGGAGMDAAEGYGENSRHWGENANRKLDCERVMVLISTNHSQRIEETIIVEVGDEGFEVSVSELGFRDDTIDPLSKSGKAKIPVESTVSPSESSSIFSSDQKQSMDSGEEMRMDDVERDTLIGEHAGKDVGAGLEQSIENLKGLLGEKEKSVSINLIFAPKSVGENEKYGNEGEAQELDMGLKIRNWAAVVSEDSKKRSEDGAGLIQEQGPVVDVSMGLDGEKKLEPNSVEVAISSGDEDITMSRACVDVRDMGLLPNLLATGSIPEMGKSSWAEEVDKRMNIHYSKEDPDQGDLETDMDKNEEESFRDFFPEMSPKKRPKNVKRYGSLMDFQDKALTKWERKKRDKALKKNKLNKKDLLVSELSGRSLSDSDLATRWNAATKEARKVLKLGKRLGMEIIGDEQEVVKEIARLELGEAD
ncbi:hypothetical protein GQ457_05G033920 [Hibiscus cannabinus]